jgi:hypothetical protein
MLGVALLSCGSVALSCNDNNDDPVGRACNVIVHDCNAMRDMSDCIDLVGDLDADCALCIVSSQGCDYFAQCQRSLVTCNLPSEIEPKGARAPSPDAGPPAPSGNAADAGR